MPAGAKPGERRGGRVKGVKNKAVIERELMIKAAQEELGLGTTPIAKDTLAEIMQYFLERAREAAAEFLATPKPVYSGSPTQRKEMRIAYEALESRATKYMKLSA